MAASEGKRRSSHSDDQFAAQKRTNTGLLGLDKSIALAEPDEGNTENPEESAIEEAIHAAWNRDYIGSASIELWRHVQERYDQLGRDGQYANLCTVIQSSGAGKSRAIDQLSTEHFVISMCLKEDDPRGMLISPWFPPPDTQVRQFFTNLQHSPPEAGVRIAAFLTALFEVAFKHVTELENAINGEDDRYVALTRLFRLRMTENQQARSPNSFRTCFYNEVMKKTETLCKAGAIFNLESTCRKLEWFLHGLRKSAISIKDITPLIIIAYDDSSILIPVLPSLRTQLSKLNRCKLFSLTLSTTEPITYIPSLDLSPDPSSRIVQKPLRLNPAFTFFPFDLFARETRDGELTISEVAGEWYMMHLGRPLWAARVDSVEESTRETLREHAMEFAVAKLLSSDTYSYTKERCFSNARLFACLAQRLPIEFLPTMEEYQLSLVESHMRICMSLNPNTRRMVTISASEPILSEAAFLVMQHPDCIIERGFKKLLTSFIIYKGDKGELLGLLLLTLARDAVVVSQNHEDMWRVLRPRRLSGRLVEWNRVIPVPDFINRLFNGLEESVMEGIGRDFQDAKMHFNHFLKVQEDGVMHRRFLVRMMARGAGMLCADNKSVTDAIIPYMLGTVLKEESTGVILCRFSNDPSYGEAPDWELLNEMDPIDLGIMDETETGRLPPVIRIFFAMGSRTSSLHTQRIEITSDRRNVEYAAYNIWCAGLDSGILKPIRSGLEDIWEDALHVSRGWEDKYRVNGNGVQEPLQMMNPGTAPDGPFWANFFPVE